MNITFMGVNVDDVFVETRYTRRFGKKKKKKVSEVPSSKDCFE